MNFNHGSSCVFCWVCRISLRKIENQLKKFKLINNNILDKYNSIELYNIIS